MLPLDGAASRLLRAARERAVAGALMLPIRPTPVVAAGTVTGGMAPTEDAPAAEAPPAESRDTSQPVVVNSAPARQAAPVSRVLHRDPVELPLVETEAWQELLLSVRLNGQVVSQGGLFVEDPKDGGLAAQLALVEALRIRVDPDRVITLHGEPYYPLAAIPGATAELDRTALSVDLSVPAAEFIPFALVRDARPRPVPTAGVGGFLDYDLLYQAGSDLEQTADGLLELGAFGPPGTLTTGLRLSDLMQAPAVKRLDTTFTRDLPGRRSTFRLGDSVSYGGAFAAPVRFAGLQYATNFGTDPSFVTFPLPAIGGLTEQQSVVDVLVDNLQRATGSVPPGPFAVENLPVVTGAGEVQLRVTDLLGRERIVTQSYYVSPRLLKEGLHDFAYEAGFERKDYGAESFDYGEPLLAATHRYGVTNRITGEVHGEMQPDQQNVIGGGSVLAGRFGVVSAGAGVGRSKEGAGVLGEFAYEYHGRRFSAGARTRYTSKGFRQAGGDEDTERTDQLNLGFDLLGYGRLGVLLVNRESRDSDEALTSVAATYSMALGPGAVSLRAAQIVDPDPELALTATYSVPLGPRRSASTTLQKRSDDLRARASYRQTRGASDLGLDYRLSAEAGTDFSTAEARFSYQTTRGTADLEVERFDGSNNLRAGVSGSVAVADGQMKLSRRIGRSFGMVSLPGFPDVRVYLDNREVGRTDAAGNLLLPGLRPYEANRVRVEVQDLPLDTSVGAAEIEAVPFERSGVTITFPVARTQQATAMFLDAAGKPLPAGLQLKSADGNVAAWVARDGFTQITGPLATPVNVLSENARTPFECALPSVPEGEILADLGVVACR